MAEIHIAPTLARGKLTSNLPGEVSGHPRVADAPSQRRRPAPIRLGVYTDMVYRTDGKSVSSKRAFVRFVAELVPRLGELTFLGRLDPVAGTEPYRLRDSGVRFVALPYYPRITSVGSMLAAVRESCRIFERELDRLDAVWIFGPHPMAVLFAWIARRRGKPLILGVRQDYPRYIAARLPGRRWYWALPVAHALEAVFRQLARRASTVAVGDELAGRYALGGPVLATGFSLVEQRDIVSAETALAKSWDGDRTLLTVTRLDQEKNPQLLLEIIARLRDRDPGWRLVIAGAGPLRVDMEREVARRGLGRSVDLLGEVTNGPELWRLYRRCQAFLHVSLTEGVPQVLFEAQAAGLPIIATDVGGVRRALNGGAAGLLIEPRDAESAVEAVSRMASDADLRRQLITAGLEHVATETLEAQLDRIAAFIAETV